MNTEEPSALHREAEVGLCMLCAGEGGEGTHPAGAKADTGAVGR